MIFSARWIMVVLALALVASACTGQPGDFGSEIEKVFHDDEPLALFNCLIIDGTGAAPIEDGIILIKDGLIVEVLSANSSTISNEYKKIDIGGRTVLPGFINAHVHNAHQEEQLQNWAKSGVTTVRDLNPRLSNFIEVRDQLNQNLHNARVISSTPMITVRNGYGSAYVDSVQEARELTKHYIDEGADVIKFSLEDNLERRQYSMLSPDETKAITDTARENNIRTSVHVTHIWNLPMVLEAGVNDIAHMVVEPLDQSMITEIIELGIYWVPTLELWKGVSGKYDINWDKIAIENLSRFHEAGGKIALGTDFGGFSSRFDDGFPITEVRMMQQAGMSNMDIIVSGTKNAAYVCHREHELGTLEAGKIADLLIIDGNPIEDIENLTNPYMVLRNGIIVYSR